MRMGVEALATTGASGDDVRQALLAAANWARHSRSPANGLAGTRTAAEPLVEILDGRPDDRPANTPWRTRVTLVRRPAGAATALADVDVVILQRLPAVESLAVSATLRLADETAHLIAQLDDDMIAVVGGAADWYVWLSPTDTEVSLFGQPTLH
jgi:hypothetical protein